MVSITMMVGLVGLTAATATAAAATGIDGWMDGWRLPVWTTTT